jgi:hypothetical protein
MDDIFNDKSRYTYSTIDKLCPIITRANYRKYLPGLVRYLDATPINETRTQGTPSEVKFEEAYMASQAAKLEYRKVIEKKDRQGKISQDMVKFIEAKLDDAEKHHATLLRRTYRYSPNLRTFILYIFNESYVKKPDVQQIQRIQSVLSKEKIAEIAPFLKYWQDFEELGLDVCTLLMTISREFRYQLHLILGKGNDYPFLLPAVTERYFLGVEEYLNMAQNVPKLDLFKKIKRINKSKFDKLPEIQNKYREWIIPLMRDLIERKLKALNGYEREVETFQFRHRRL